MTSFVKLVLCSTKSSKNSGSSWFFGLFSGFIFSVVVVEVSSVVVMEVVVMEVVVEAVVVVVSGSFSTRIFFINFTFFSGQFSSSSPKAHSIFGFKFLFFRKTKRPRILSEDSLKCSEAWH